jgi:plastocyanin
MRMMTAGSAVARLRLIALCLVVSACATQPTINGTRVVHDIHISERVVPEELVARMGDEIRWHNHTSKPVTVGLLESKWLDGVTCETGFRGFGRIDDIVTVKPGHYVSLCFARKGAVHYNVWLDSDNMRTSMTPTAVIHIREGSTPVD